MHARHGPAAWTAGLSLLWVALLSGCGGSKAPVPAKTIPAAAPQEGKEKALTPKPQEQAAAEDSAAKPADGFLAQRSTFVTKLLEKEPAPQPYDKETPPKGVREITYPSGDLKLKAWYAAPPGAGKGNPAPVFVYFHGGFAFGAGDFEVCEPFLKAGFAVMAPMLRGENGNPGWYEMFYGEVDDARAALAWVIEQPETDGKHVYTFGHSAGGAISALIALYPDTPVRITASAGGMYHESLLTEESLPVPYDSSNAMERKLRSYPFWAAEAKIPHIAYVGQKDAFIQTGAYAARLAAAKTKAPLQVVEVAGDHFESLDASIPMLLREIQKDLKK